MMDSVGRGVMRSHDPAVETRTVGDLLRGYGQSAYDIQAGKRLFAPIEEIRDGDSR